jgi:23S rRNA U2552 (ribose-2'-O)-methylase RlmE/FtsJ
MIFFLLPRTYLYTYKHLELIECSETPAPYISTSLSHYLNDIKERIEEHTDEWEKYKKYTNPCEFIHTNIPNKNKNVSKYIPLSRSYFKMVEIIQHFNLFACYSGHHRYELTENWYSGESTIHLRYTPENFQSPIVPRTSGDFPISHPIRTFHLAEGPGGFIEAFLKMRNNPLDKYIGMTILDKKNDSTIPSWKKSGKFMRENHNNVFIENGEDQTGNILSLQNFVYCKDKYESSMDFITADGGFDFSNDFKNQENSIVRLLFAQIAFAICMQKHNGTFILKIFDTFMLHSIDLLYLLSSLYREVYICKPQTSRCANSEKYVVCKYFIHSSCNVIYPYLFQCFQNMMENDFSKKISTCDSANLLNFHSLRSCDFLTTKWKKNTKKHAKEIGRFLNIPISNLFITRLEEYNSILGQQQIENIYNTIMLIETRYKTEKINNLLKTNIQKSIQWCVKHKIPHNYSSAYSG